MKGHRHHGHHHSDQLERMTTLRRFGPGPEGPGFGFGPGSGPRQGFGGPPLGGGRGRRRRGDVRFALLRALEDDPQNGYQLMQGIEERTGGRWRPSPGSVYPALAQLEDQGFVRSTDSDGGRTFETTDTGRKHIADHDQDPPWLGDDEPDTLADLKTQLKQIHIATALVLRA